MIKQLICLDYGANVNKQDRVNRWTPLMQETYQSINLDPISSIRFKNLFPIKLNITVTTISVGI